MALDWTISKPNVVAEEIYCAASANRHENGLTTSDRFLLYSRCHCPVLYDLEKNKVASILIGHSGEVNGLEFIEPCDDQDQSQDLHLISSSYDKSAILWSVDKEKPQRYQLLHKYLSPEDCNFTTRCSIRLDSSKFLTILTTIKGSVWLSNDFDILIKQASTPYVSIKSRIHSIHIGSLVYRFLLLAGSDNKLHIFQIHDTELCHLIDIEGHSDWVKGIDTLNLIDRECEFLIATSSQDTFIRVWQMKLISDDNDLLAQDNRTKISAKAIRHPQTNTTYRLSQNLETVISCHDQIVFSVCWFKKLKDSKLRLISCSADKTIAVHESPIAPIEESNSENRYQKNPASVGIWKEVSRYGETGENNLPFLGVCLSRDESLMIAQSLRGAIHRWRVIESDSWAELPTIGGHFEPVSDLSWERPSGSYLLSSSLDKTCRLHALTSAGNWAEVFRPQVHGHELNSVVSLSPSKLATGAEEKTIRVFEATQFFLKSFQNLCNIYFDERSDVDDSRKNLPKHAQLPVLGLSNKAADSPYGVDSGDKTKSGDANNAWYGTSELAERLASMDKLYSLPTEDILLQSTLWWETNKLFGHGNEIFSLATNSSGTYLASASKANQSELANVIVWEMDQFRKAATIEHHSLTVTRLRFSPDDKYLLSVSRDRTWCLSEKTGKPRPAYRKLLGSNKSNSSHKRIIWDCAWTWDSKYFLTVSRDQMAILWAVDDAKSSIGKETIEYSACEQFNQPIRAVDSPIGHSISPSEYYLFALGFEDGSLEIQMINLKPGHPSLWQLLHKIDFLHHLPIRRLAFKPNIDPSALLLASGGQDNVLKITKLSLI